MIEKTSILSPKIGEYLALDYAEEAARTKPSPSKAGYCALKAFRQYTRNEKTEMDERGLYNVWKGRTLHEGISKLIATHGHDIMEHIEQNKKVEFEIPSGKKLSGEADLVCTIEDVEYVVDWKFPNSRSFMWTKKNGQPQAHYVDQLMIYMHALQIDDALLIYCGEGNEFLEFHITYDSSRVWEILMKFDDIMHHKDEKEIIQRHNVPEESWECGYCQYEKECKEKEIIK